MAGFVTGSKLGVYAFLSAATNTTVATANSFTPILGTFTNNPLEGFVLDSGKLVYKGKSGMTFEIDWHASFSAVNANQTVHFGININSETLTTTGNGVVGTFAKNAGQAYAVSGTRVVTLNHNDTVQLQLTSDTNADVVNVKHFTTTMAKFYRGSE
jgi:hypothetical protein